MPRKMRAELLPPSSSLLHKHPSDSLPSVRAQTDYDAANMQMLESIRSGLTYEHNLDAVYEKLMDAAVVIMRSDYASMQMLYPERGRGGELRLLAFRGFNPQAAKFWEWVNADSKSTCGLVLRTGKRVIAPDIESCDFMDDSEDQRVYLQTGIHACQTTPLVAHDGSVVGMISTHWRKPHQPSERDFQLLDILARQAADLIRRERQTFAELVERAPFGIYVVDSQFRISQMNAGSRIGAFRNVQPVIGRDFSEAMRILWPKPVAEGIIREFRHTIDTGESYYSRDFINARQDKAMTESYEWELHRITLPDGRYGVVCYYFDSTRLRQAEAEARQYKHRLRLEEERLRLTRTVAKVAPWQYDPLAETFEWSSEVFDLFGGTSPGVTLESFLSLMSYSSDREGAFAALTNCTRRRKDCEFVFRLVRPDGEVKLISARGRPFYNQGNTILLGMFIDMTGTERDVHPAGQPRYAKPKRKTVRTK